MSTPGITNHGKYLESLQVNRQDRDEESMRQEPVCHKDHHSESTELSNGTIGKASDNTQDCVIGTALQGVGRSGPA